MAKHHRPHCLVCGSSLGRPIVECPHCSTPHHRVCWRYNGGCAVYGCAGRPGTDPEVPDWPPESMLGGATSGSPIDHVERRSIRVDLSGDAVPPPPQPPRQFSFGFAVIYMALLVTGALRSGPTHATVGSSRMPPSPPRLTTYAGCSTLALTLDRHSRMRADIRSIVPATTRLVDPALKRLIHDDRLWEGTGSVPGARLLKICSIPEARQLERSLIRARGSYSEAWQQVRVDALLGALRTGGRRDRTRTGP